MSEFKFTADQKLKNGSIVILESMVNRQHYQPVNLEGNDKLIEDYLIWLYGNKHIIIRNNQYVPTESGRKIVVEFMKRYAEYIQVYDVFSLVDLENGEFAFSEYYDVSDEEWEDIANDYDKYDDVRGAVVEFKGMDRLECLFMEFLAEGDFNTTEPGWQKRIAKDALWDKMEEIANTAIPLEDLKEDDAITDIIKQGMELMVNMKHREAELDAEEAAAEANAPVDDEDFEDEEVVEEVVEYVEIVEEPEYELDYWDVYYDPFYVPVWYYDPYW